jgi:hypothetical protein
MTTTATKRQPKKRLSGPARERRDKLILTLFLAGVPKYRIAQHPQVKLSWQQVNNIVNTELEQAQLDHVVYHENAMTIYLARLESLYNAAWEHVQDGDPKSIEVCRRLLDQQQKLFGLAADERGTSSLPPISDAELDSDGEPMDELARYRAQRGLPKAQGS